MKKVTGHSLFPSPFRRLFPRTAFFFSGGMRVRGNGLRFHEGFPRLLCRWLRSRTLAGNPWREHRDGKPLYFRETIGMAVGNMKGIAKIQFT